MYVSIGKEEEEMCKMVSVLYKIIGTILFLFTVVVITRAAHHYSDCKHEIEIARVIMEFCQININELMEHRHPSMVNCSHAADTKHMRVSDEVAFRCWADTKTLINAVIEVIPFIGPILTDLCRPANNRTSCSTIIVSLLSNIISVFHYIIFMTFLCLFALLYFYRPRKPSVQIQQQQPGDQISSNIDQHKKLLHAILTNFGSDYSKANHAFSSDLNHQSGKYA